MDRDPRDADVTLPRGPHETIGPSSVRMPRWPGPVLAISGALLALGALGVGTLVALGRLAGDTDLLTWLTVIGGLLFGAGLAYSAVRQLRIRRFLAPERYRGPGVLVLLGLVLVLATIIQLPFTDDVLALTLGEGDLSPLGSVVVLLSTPVALLVVSWLFVFRPNALAGVPSLRGRNALGAIGSGIGYGVAGWLIANLVGAVVIVLLEAIGVEPDVQVAEQAIGLLDPWLIVLAIVLLAPVAEEIFFRGIVFNAWLREGGRRWAFVGSTLLFAVIHLSIAAFVPIILLGLGLAWVYARTRNLLAPIAMHATFNAISVTLALLTRYEIITLPV